jgi:hypothetical protein
LGPRQTTTSQPGFQVDSTDRRSNLIIFGVDKDRDISVWHSAVGKILNCVAGHLVETMDMFRLGRYINGVDRKPRPILVKLRIAWDRCINLSKGSTLKNYSQAGIFISADEAIEVRRKNTFERLKNRAVQAGQSVAVIDSILIINDVMMFSVEKGYLRNRDGRHNSTICSVL